jgi:hypothetical protein
MARRMTNLCLLEIGCRAGSEVKELGHRDSAVLPGAGISGDQCAEVSARVRPKDGELPHSSQNQA